MDKIRKIRAAFVKFGGLSAGGTERWLQMMAANLPRDQFEVDYYYCDAAPYVGSDYRHADTDPARVKYMQEHGVNLIKFRVGAKDVTKPTHDWVDTDFWQVFDPNKYDLVQTAKAGPAEYPYYDLPLPVVEYITLSAGVDHSRNIVCSVHLSQWQRARWFRSGGALEKSDVIPIPAEPPATTENMRADLGIPPSALVAGFHQRADDHIFSPIPLNAFHRIQQPGWHFIIMGGGEPYRKQSVELGLKNVLFVPHSGDSHKISAFLNTLDIFAHGRKDGETFGTVFAEAMMHGKPCLSHWSEIANGQPETMGPAGLFARDEDEYREKLSCLFSDGAVRNRLGSKGRLHAQEYYSLESCVTKLTQIYRRICSPDQELRSQDSLLQYPIPYGQSDLGFLYAGRLAEPGSIAYHVMAGGIPNELSVQLVRHLLPQASTFVDIGANTGLYCFVAAKDGVDDIAVHVFEQQANRCAIMGKTVWLNNWEQKVFVHQVAIGAPASELPLPSGRPVVETLDNQVCKLGLRKVDFIRIGVPDPEGRVFEACKSIIKKDRPVIFAEFSHGEVQQGKSRGKNSNDTISWLEEEGYIAWRFVDDCRLEEVGRGHARACSGTHLCLNVTLHDQQIRALDGWIAEYSRYRTREKRRRMWSRISKALRHPRWAAGRILARARAVVLARAESANSSYLQHHSEYLQPDALIRHVKTYSAYEETDLFNHPENKFGRLIEQYPTVRGVAVDMGAGAGWLSARLSRHFEQVIAIEPSEAAIGLAKQMFSADKYPNITWKVGFAEEFLGEVNFDKPVLFVTGCVLSHLPDDLVRRICKSIDRAGPVGSILGFAECWGSESHEFMWHVRTQEWWQDRFPGWQLDFHGPTIQDKNDRHKGFHGLRVR